MEDFLDEAEGDVFRNTQSAVDSEKIVEENSCRVASSTRPELKYKYKEDQWSPINTEGKRQYDRVFLMQLQYEVLSLQKPKGLPDLEIIKEKPVTNCPKNSFDFTPGSVKGRNSDGFRSGEGFNLKTIDETRKEAYENMIQNNTRSFLNRMDRRNPSPLPDTGKIRRIRSLDTKKQGFKMWGYGSSDGNKSFYDASGMKTPAAPILLTTLLSGEPNDRKNFSPRSDFFSGDFRMTAQLSHEQSGSKERKRLLDSISNLCENTKLQVKCGGDNSVQTKKSKTEMEKKTEHVIDEFLRHCDLEAVILEFKRISSPNTALYFVSSSIDQILERSDKVRNQIGHLLHNLVKKKVLSMQQYIDGLKEILQCADDFEVDIPRFWVYIGEIIAPMIHNDSASLSFLVDIAQPLTQINKAGKLVAEVLHASSKALGPVMLRNLWNNSGLEWSSFVKSDRINDFIEENKLHFMIQQSETPPLNIENVKHKLDSLLLQRNADNDEIMDWFDGNIGSVNAENPLFIRALMTAVCESAIKGEGTSSILDKEVFKQRMPLLHKCLDNKENLELHALYALQRLLHRLEHPLSVVTSIFDLLYDEEVISEDVFSQWENSKDPAEQEGHAILMKSLTMFFTWLREPEEFEESDDPAK